MDDNQYISFGATGVNLTFVATLTEEEFRNIFKGVLNYDLNDACKELKKINAFKKEETTIKKSTKKRKYANPEE